MEPEDKNRISPGGFYWSNQPGGWADAATGIHIPGPIVKLDKVTRQVIGVDSMPAPVQLPTHKISFSLQNSKETVECEFDRYDSEALTEGFNLALQTGNIEQVPLELVKELYPRAFAARQEKIVFRRESRERKALPALLHEFMQNRRVQLKSKSADEIDAAKAQEREADRVRRIQNEMANSVPGAASLNATAEPQVPPQATQEQEIPPAPPVPPEPPATQ